VRRREFIALLGGTAAAAFSAFSLALRQAQGQNRPRVGFIFSGSSASNELVGFNQGLRELGYVEGQNIDIEYRFAENSAERLGATMPAVFSRAKSRAIYRSCGRLSSSWSSI
jgi:putative ABC transport system substrate-binding protein